MKLGLITPPEGVGGTSLAALIEWAVRAENDGFHSLWIVQVPVAGNDVLTAIAVLGQHTHRILLGSGVAPTYPRHPMVMAHQALTVQVATGGRLQLGLGLSHRPVIEDMMGLSYDSPAQHMREYLSVVAPLKDGLAVNFEGEHYRVQGSLSVPQATPYPILVAALGPQMLKVAGELADGTITWMVGLQTMSDHIVPKITAASHARGKSPRVVASLPVVVTDDAAAVCTQIDSSLELYGQLESYRRMLDREGVAAPSGVSIVGCERVVRERLMAFAAAGVTEFVASIATFEGADYQRTYECLQGLVEVL